MSYFNDTHKADGQVILQSVERMPGKPLEKPLDWSLMAAEADKFLMDPSNGVLHIDKDGNKYFTAFLEGKSKELITFGCVVAGKILRGDDVSELLPSLSAFYSKTNSLFLNSPDHNRIEHWYLMDVNALAASIIKLKLAEDSLFMGMWRNSAESLVKLAHKLDYDFNTQGFNFDTESPFTVKDIFRQPDAIAGYAYLMTFAYKSLKDNMFLEEAKKAMDIYQSFKQNPWYEIPSGAMACLAAVHLNSMGFHYNITGILNFALDDSKGGLLTGLWGGKEINGLMKGWYGSVSAYSMETMITLPYILPVVRYEPQFAYSIGKYALNAASNARLFFSEYLPAELQSKPNLKLEIPYERLDECNDGKMPYAAGDFEGHKSVYGGGFTLWWGSIIKPTNDEFILQFDVTKTDFWGIPHILPIFTITRGRKNAV